MSLEIPEPKSSWSILSIKLTSTFLIVRSVTLGNSVDSYSKSDLFEILYVLGLNLVGVEVIAVTPEMTSVCAIVSASTCTLDC